MNTNPYPGLRAFEYAENHLFFGREGHAEKIANRLEQNHFVAVVGSSGSGKSSVVRAGLLPLLYSGRMFGSSSRWKISLMRPGDTPIHNLATSLVHPEKFDDSGLFDGTTPVPSKDENQIGIVETILRRSGVGLIDFLKTANLEKGENLLIVVDQFEELFRFKEKMRVGHTDEAAAFVKLLLEATKGKQNRIYIITTMRSDFLGDCAEFRGLPEAINDGQYLVSRMTRNQLRSSIESPAKVFDAEVSPVLVNLLLNNLEDDGNHTLEFRERMLQDQLPVMQHALMRTWDEWESRNTPNEKIGMEHYKATGAMERALFNHANEAFEELTDKQKKIAEKMFKCLTEKDEEKRETRRPTTVGEICAIAGAEKEEVFAVIEVFRQEGRTFLMPPPSVLLTKNTKIDISHESLIRNWDVLKKWVAEEAKDAWHYRRLSENANNWFYENSKDEDFLWRGRAVEDAVTWWKSFAPNQVWAKRYQILNEREKLQLVEISRISPDEEPVRRQNLMTERFNEAAAFLEESQNFELREQDRKERLRQAEARGRYTKWLAGAAVMLFLLLGATAYFAFDAVNRGRQLMANEIILKEKEKELLAKNDSLELEQKKLKEAEQKLREINKEEKKQREIAVDEKERADIEADKANDERENALTQKARADKEARQAKISENQAKINATRAEAEEQKAKEATILAEASKYRAEQLAQTLELSRDGFVNIEYENFAAAKTNFEQYLLASGDQKEKYGKWWGNHNLAITNWNLSKVTDDTGEFTEAERNFIEALRELGYDENVISEIEPRSDVSQNSTISFSSISYDKTLSRPNQNTDDSEKSIIITLRKFARFYREFATNTELHKKVKCFPGEGFGAIFIVSGEDPSEKYRIPCLKFKAHLLYKSLLNRGFNNSDIKADIQIEYVQTLLNEETRDESEIRLADVRDIGSAIELYDSALDSYRRNGRTLKYITHQTELVQYFLEKNDVDQANDRADRIIETKNAALIEKDGKSLVDALTDSEFSNIYANLGELYSNRLSEYEKEYSNKINELRNRSQNDPEVIIFLDRLSNDIFSSQFRLRDYVRILNSNEKLKLTANEIFGSLPADKFEKLSNTANLFLFNSETFIAPVDKAGIAEVYFSNGQCEDAAVVLEQWLKDQDREVEEIKSTYPFEADAIKFVSLANSAEIYHKYNYKNKAKEKYDEFYGFYRKVANDIDKYTYWHGAFRGGPATQAGPEYYPNILRKAGRFFYFELGDNEKALSLFREGERLLQINRDHALSDIEKAKSIMRMQLYVGFALEHKESAEALKYYNDVRIFWSEYRQNIKNLDAQFNSKRETLDALDTLLRIRLANLYLINSEPQKADEMLCLNRGQNGCKDEIHASYKDDKSLTIIYPERYVDGIRTIADFKKNQNDIKGAADYLNHALSIFRRLETDFTVLEYNQFFFSGVYFPDYSNELTRSHRPSEKFFKDYMGVLEALQNIESDQSKKAERDKEINRLRDEMR